MVMSYWPGSGAWNLSVIVLCSWKEIFLLPNSRLDFLSPHSTHQLSSLGRLYFGAITNSLYVSLSLVT